jgi:tetratricopeptide (TPR) repeat protein
VFDPTSPRLGESWTRGPIVLAWDHVAAAARGGSPGLNVVIHEFSHHLDAMGYRSPKRDGESHVNQIWSEAMEAAYLRLIGRARRGEISWLDQHGATHRAEFFACACERFFETPRAMLTHYEDVYKVLRGYFQQDPANWSSDRRAPDPLEFAEHNDSHAARHDGFAWRGILYYDVAADVGSNEPVESFQDFSQLSGDAAFTIGIRYLSAGQAAEAQAAFSQTIAEDPDDAEAHAMRARARSRRGRFAEALADAELALGMDANDLAALREKGAALLGMHRYDEARTYLRGASEHVYADAESFFLYGVALLKCEDWRAAAHNLTCSLVLTPLSAAALLHRSHAAQMLGKRNAAEQDLLKARQLDPDIEARVSQSFQ